MKMRRLLLWVLLVFVLDQASKILISHVITPGESVIVIPHFFDIVHVTNKGAAFGMLANLPDPYRFISLVTVSLLAMGLIIYYYWSLPLKHRSLQIPLALILGGAIGNIFDRLYRGSVIDFLSFHWYDKWVRWEIGPYIWTFKLEWPAFNVADTAISCSVICILVILAKGGMAERNKLQ